MEFTVYQVDAFREGPFRGNPAGVCLLALPQSDENLQAIAAEMNLSETAFLSALPDGEYSLRWFTPRTEVKLCGHATLASAHVLWEKRILAGSGSARFHTLSGLLVAQKLDEEITLDFPARLATPADPDPDLLKALGLDGALFVGRHEEDYLVQIASAERLRQLRPNFAALLELSARGVIVTSPSDDPRFDFLSRFFAPAVGIDEDPVTGSAHCALVPFWAAQTGKAKFVACQVSARGGVLRLELKDERVLIGGRAETTGQREIQIG